MTNADTINADLARMEGDKCEHRWRTIGEAYRGATNKFEHKYECSKCYETIWNSTWEGPLSIPDRISDGTYILGLVERYNLTVVPEDYGWRVFPRFLKNSNFHSKDKFVKHAIALAAIQRWKEGG